MIGRLSPFICNEPLLELMPESRRRISHPATLRVSMIKVAQETIHRPQHEVLSEGAANTDQDYILTYFEVPKQAMHLGRLL